MRRVPVFESLALALALIVMAAVGVVQKQRDQQAVESYSSYESNAGGFRAWYQLLEHEGVRTGRFEERSSFLDRYTQALIVGSPPLSLSNLTGSASEDTTALAAWVRAGGHLLVVGNGTFTLFAASALHLAKTAEASATEPAVPFVAPPLARWGVRNVRADNGARLSLGKGATALLSDRHGVLVERHALGHGEVVHVIDGSLLRNAGIGTPDRARLAFALASIVAGPNPIVFDETIHGYLTPEHWWQVLPRRFVIALFIAGFVLAIAFIGAAIRLGPPRVLAPPPAPTSADYLDALTALMERARAAAASLAQALRSTRQMLAARLGVAEDAPPALVAERIDRKDLRAAFLELDALACEEYPANGSVVRGLTLAFRLREEYAPHAADR